MVIILPFDYSSFPYYLNIWEIDVAEVLISTSLLMCPKPSTCTYMYKLIHLLECCYGFTCIRTTLKGVLCPGARPYKQHEKKGVITYILIVAR